MSAPFPYFPCHRVSGKTHRYFAKMTKVFVFCRICHCFVLDFPRPGSTMAEKVSRERRIAHEPVQRRRKASRGASERTPEQQSPGRKASAGQAKLAVAAARSASGPLFCTPVLRIFQMGARSSCGAAGVCGPGSCGGPPALRFPGNLRSGGTAR